MYTFFEDDLVGLFTEELRLIKKMQDKPDGNGKTHLSLSNPRLTNKKLVAKQKEKLSRVRKQMDEYSSEGYKIVDSVVLQYKFLDPVILSKKVTVEQDLHKDNHKNAHYVVACLMTPEHNRSCSLSIGIAKLLRNSE